MRRLTIIMTLLATPALAADRLTVSGAGDHPPMVVEIQPAEDHAANVIFHNSLTDINEGPDDPFALSIGGLEVVVDLSIRLGHRVDTMTVLPPAGYVAIPPEISVPEFEVGVIEIHRFEGM